jgi:cytochrome b561
MGAGIILFLCLISTAVVGLLIMKGKGNIPFALHVNLARLTIVLVLIHATLAMVWFFGW